ncbi:hypothetical protein LshimejAT787_0905800 [Lyophyllum shimeji]|uniref:F-box domain-containing protein n=1 Tax=Lyophyllum shimeji TaxID=47721 RepID=A0A9P3URI3_LYOSH|nr:hypothetical protein LshimejAT787_0905800 [Lyophyllum shimeji]
MSVGRAPDTRIFRCPFGRCLSWAGVSETVLHICCSFVRLGKGHATLRIGTIQTREPKSISHDECGLLRGDDRAHHHRKLVDAPRFWSIDSAPACLAFLHAILCGVSWKDQGVPAKGGPIFKSCRRAVPMTAIEYGPRGDRTCTSRAHPSSRQLSKGYAIDAILRIVYFIAPVFGQIERFIAPAHFSRLRWRLRERDPIPPLPLITTSPLSCEGQNGRPPLQPDAKGRESSNRQTGNAFRRHSTFALLPMEILLEIAWSLLPADLLALSRVSKQSRGIFLLIFDQLCSACRSVRASKVHYTLRLRFCSRCEKANLKLGYALARPSWLDQDNVHIWHLLPPTSSGFVATTAKNNASYHE